LHIKQFKEGCPTNQDGVEWKDCTPDWPDGVTEKNWPVAYLKNSLVTIKEARFKVKDKNPPFQNATVAGLAKLSNGQTMYFIKTGVKQVGNELIINNVVSIGTLPNYVSALDNGNSLKIDWTVTEGGVFNAGSSNHPIFVLFSQPTTSPLFLTLVDFSSHDAEGKAAANDVANAIWTEYTDRIVQRRELNPVSGQIAHFGSNLQYYTPWNLGTDDLFREKLFDKFWTTKCRIWTTAEILEKTMGRCGGWAHFMEDSFKTHGLNASYQGLDDLPDFVRPADGSQFMLIKNWKFGTATGAGVFPYLMEVQKLSRGQNTLGLVFLKKEFDDAPGAAGQSNPNPPGWFGIGDHAVVVYNGKIYDPSYGNGPFDTFRQWEAASLDGYGKKLSETTEQLPEGTKQSTVVFGARKGTP
jgi:hypothetical protein